MSPARIAAALMTAVGVTGVVVTAGCSSSTRLAHPAPATTTTSQPTGTTEPAGVTTTAPGTTTTTTTAPAGFTPASVPAAIGDVDGDGRPDKVSISWNATGAVVTAVLTRLGTQTLPVQVDPFLLTDPSVHPAVLGVVDINADGFAEVMVQVGQGASTSAFTILALVGGRLTQVLMNGAPAMLALGGSVGHFTRFGCESGQVVVAAWSSTDPTASSYHGERDVYRLSGAQLTLAAKTTITFATGGQPPSAGQLSAAGYLVHCPPID
jgi:hypothetical protein